MSNEMIETLPPRTLGEQICVGAAACAEIAQLTATFEAPATPQESQFTEIVNFDPAKDCNITKKNANIGCQYSCTTTCAETNV